MTNSGWEDEDELQTPTVEEQNFPDSKVYSTLPGKVFLTNIYLARYPQQIYLAKYP